jgi:hypothetical protein
MCINNAEMLVLKGHNVTPEMEGSGEGSQFHHPFSSFSPHFISLIN